MRLLITGGTGFVGANLVHRFLGRGARVGVLARPGSDRWRLAGLGDEIEWFEADLLDRAAVAAALAGARPDAVLHLAAAVGHATTAAERRRHLDTSVLGTLSLVEACGDHRVGRIVFAGSSLVYGRKSTPHLESDPIRPFSFRGLAKAAAWQACRMSAEAAGIEAVCLRLFSVYGPWQQPARLIPTATRAALEGRELALPEPGYVRDLVYVEDVADAFERALTAAAVDGEVINIGSGRETTLEGIVERIGAAAGSPVEISRARHDPGPFDVRSWRADVEKAAQLLRWEPQTDLETGLAATVEWCRKRRAPWIS